MKTKVFILSLAAFLPLTASAQQVPAIENVSYSPGSFLPVKRMPVETVPAPVIRAIPIESEPVMQKPPSSDTTLGADGSIVFNYGSKLPSIVCAPLHVCEVSLQPGETIQQIDVGDPVRWQVKLARSNRDNVETSHLIIKPTESNISSNLVAITDKRTYSMRLLSKSDHSWMAKVAFSYPDDVQANWQAYFAQNTQPAKTNNLVANIASQTVSPALDFNYHLKGDKPSWRPVRVYTDNAKTYIQFPAAVQNDEIPVLLVLGPGSSEQLVNYRMEGNAFVVDKVIQRAVLISGVGKQQARVNIQREGS